jgi:hypothetical protein
VHQREHASPRINPACTSILLEHGQRTPRAVAFLHGITSSPVQFRALGELFHARGYNVFIPRMPRHGYRDRLTLDPANLTVAEYIAYANQTVDIARGLGDHLAVAGLSVSGVVAAWCAQTRADIDLAVPIAPAFAPHVLPFPLVPVLNSLLKLLPNFFVWWDFRLRARVGHPCGYPRFASHAMAESFHLGRQVYRAAKGHPPACARILAITNPRDMAVNNAATRAVLRRWRSHTSGSVREYTFGPELGPLHDIIGPYQPNARVDYVYPILFDLINAAH